MEVHEVRYIRLDSHRGIGMPSDINIRLRVYYIAGYVIFTYAHISKINILQENLPTKMYTLADRVIVHGGRHKRRKW